MKITPRKKQILEFVKKYSERKGFSPSIPEIGKRFKIAISTVHQHLEELKQAGYLNKEKNQRRAVELSPANQMINVPIVGTIAAGKPIDVIEISDKSISVPKNEVKGPQKHYALQVAGDSMIDEGIFDGDLVIIRKQETAENGQTVVAIIDDNQATLKKLYREKKRFRLQPANPRLLPLYRDEVEVRGVVVKIIRNLQDKAKTSLAEKRDDFLKTIKSTNPDSQNKYKRVTVSPIRYAGGKSLAVGHVLELLPDNITKVVSPFLGGGSIEIAISKYLGLEVIGYDIFDILCNYWNFQIKKPEVLFQKLQKLQPDKVTFEKIRLILNDVWRKKKELDPLTLAVYYVYNFNLSYGPGFMGWSSDIYLDKVKYQRMIERIRDFSPGNFKVACADFRDVIKKHPNDFLYCDPPYYLGDGSKMFRGIYPMRNIPVHHNGFPHEELRDLLKKHKGGFILSYNNCPTVREYYKDFQQSFPTWQYTMGQGETRIGKNRIQNGDNHIKGSHEIIIYSPPQKS